MKIVLTNFLLLVSLYLNAQAKKPTLMILPSDNWCNQRFFMTEYDNQGTKMKVPDYKRAFQEDIELGQVIAKIGGLMADRGFPVKDAEQEIKNMEMRAAEDNVSESKTGSSIAESPLDKLKKRAKADIIIQVWWNVIKSDKGKAVSFTLQAFDSYTSKQIAESSGTGAPSPEDPVPVLLEKAIQLHIDPFTAQLQAHFDDMFKNGREVLLTVKIWSSWDKDLEAEIEGKEITDYILEWMQKNTVSGRFNTSDASETMIRFEQVRIPLNEANGAAMDARSFAKGLQKYLQGAPFNFQVKLMTRGLGEAILVLGEK